METRKKVIVLGSGNSGSGAIFDYLAKRKDFHSPLNHEFRLIQDPGGIMDLHAALIFGFHVNRANTSIKRFIDLCERCGQEKTKFQLGLYYNKRLNDFERNVEQFVNSITAVEYKGMPFCETSKLSKLETYIYRKKLSWAKKRGEKFLYGTARLPVTEDIFLQKTELFLNSIFDIPEIDPEYKTSIAIDQGGSFWQPASSTKYYGKNRKAVVVSRDPRGVFSSFKTKGRAYPGEGVELFCEWYRNMMKHVDYTEWEDENVLHIQYEDFVNKFEDEKIRLNDFLEIPLDLHSSINISKSAFNSKKFQNRLSDREKDVIENELKEFLYF